MRVGTWIVSAVCAALLLAASGNVKADYEDNGNNQDHASAGLIIGERNDELVVIHVIKDSPADDAGLERGDRIVAIDGEEVQSPREYMQRLREKDEGDTLEIEVQRNGETETYDVTLERLEEVLQAAMEDDRFRRRARDARMQVQLRRLQDQVQQLQRQIRQLEQRQEERTARPDLDLDRQRDGQRDRDRPQRR